MAAAVADPFALVGTLLADRFVIEATVAEGGFGVVYRARQQGLGRAVAIKVLKLSDELSQRTRMAVFDSFRREARIVAELAHPSIVQVIDFDLSPTPSGVTAPWMALEWLDGEALDDWIRARRGERHTPAEALDLLRPAFEALHEAHARGVAHRDLKPANLMCVRGLAGTVRIKVLDFGIARLMEPDDVAGSGETKTRSTFTPYSPSYAAPEQVSRARTGPWTDVHALGLILCELLTGFAPYAGDDLTALAVAALSPVRPTPARWSLDVGPWEPLLTRALSLRPAERFPDAGAFFDALAATVDAATRAAATEGPTDPEPAAAPAPVRPRRSVPAPLVAGFVVLGLAATVVGWRIASYATAPVAPVPVAVAPLAPASVAATPQLPPTPVLAVTPTPPPQSPSPPTPAATAPGAPPPPPARDLHPRRPGRGTNRVTPSSPPAVAPPSSSPAAPSSPPAVAPLPSPSAPSRPDPHAQVAPE